MHRGTYDHHVLTMPVESPILYHRSGWLIAPAALTVHLFEGIELIKRGPPCRLWLANKSSLFFRKCVIDEKLTQWRQRPRYSLPLMVTWEYCSQQEGFP